MSNKTAIRDKAGPETQRTAGLRPAKPKKVAPKRRGYASAREALAHETPVATIGLHGPEIPTTDEQMESRFPPRLVLLGKEANLERFVKNVKETMVADETFTQAMATLKEIWKTAYREAGHKNLGRALAKEVFEL